MKFIHLADLHLGKIIYQKSLIDIQIDLLNQVIDYMNEKKKSIHLLLREIFMIERLLHRKVLLF